MIADPHFGAQQNSDVMLNNQECYYYNEFLPSIIEKGIKEIVILGDVFETRSSVNVKIMNAVYKFFDSLRDFRVIVLVGNHDSYLESSLKYHSLKFLSNYDNVTLIDKCQEITLCENVPFFAIPWVTNAEEFEQEFSKAAQKYCVGHLAMVGFKINSVYTSDFGFPVEKFRDKFDKTFLGHFHKRSEKPDTNVVYVGSPYQLKREDRGNDNGYMAVWFENNVLKYEFVNAKNTIKFIKIKYPEIPSEIDVKNNIIDIDISYSDSLENDKINEYMKVINSMKPASNPNINIVGSLNVTANDQLSSSNFSNSSELINEYVNSISIEDKNLPKVLGLMNELYEENRTGEI